MRTFRSGTIYANYSCEIDAIRLKVRQILWYKVWKFWVLGRFRSKQRLVRWFYWGMVPRRRVELL